ncbi:MAG: Trk system potassium transporter TrkA [Spirochaetia bacterium]
MDVIILGASEVGFQLAKQLIYENRKVTLIEKHPQRAKLASSQLDCMVINQSGNNLALLIKAGIKEAQYFIAVTESDEINMISCGLAASVENKPITIARVRNIDYSNSAVIENKLFGIDYVFNPEIEAAKVITRSIEQGAMSNVMLFENENLEMRSIVIRDGSPLVHKKLEELRKAIDKEFLIPVIQRNNNYIVPSGDTTIEYYDLIYLLSAKNDFEDILRFFGMKKREIRNIAIVGGGRIGRYIIEALGQGQPTGKNILARIMNLTRQKRKKIHIIEYDYELCKYLTERFPHIDITNADVSEESIWEDEILSDYDLLISTTGSQELNIITSIYAKKMNIDRTIAMVKKNSYQSIANELGIDVSVSMNNTLVNSIQKIIRKGNIRSVHNVSGSSFEILELVLEASSQMCNQKIEDIKLPKNTIILYITRESKNMIPGGDTELTAGDHIVIITQKNTIQKIERLFTGQ